MTDTTVTLRLTGDNSKLLPAVTESEKAVKKFGDTTSDSGRKAGGAAAGVTQLGNASEQTARKATAMSTALNSARAAIGAYAGAQAASGLIRMADQYANITGRLKLATSSQTEFAAAQAEVFAISQRTSTALDSTASLYARLAQNTAEYGVTQQRQLALTETINRTFAVSGTSAVAASNTITQFTQALAGGVLRAEEFNSIIENSPRLAKALADGLNIGMGELRKQVNDGAITVDRMITALESQASVIETEFMSIPLTVERAMEQLRNSVMRTAGEVSGALGVGSGIAGAVSMLANSMGTLADAAGLVAVAYAGKLVAGLGAATLLKVQGVLQARVLAVAELEAARAAEVHAAARINMARAGISSAGGVVAAEAAMAAAQARTAAAVQASSFALTAKAAATRAASTAMAAFGGPVGLAITALTLFVLWATNSEKKAKELADSVRKGFQPAIDQLERFSAATANADFANLAEAEEQLQKTRDQVESLTDKYGDLLAAKQRASAMDNAAGAASYAQQMEETSKQLDQTTLKQEQLTASYERAIDIATDLVLEKSGIADATEAERKSLEDLVAQQIKERTSLENSKPVFVDWVAKVRDATTANRLNEASLRDVAAAAGDAGAAVKNATQEISQGLSQQIRQLELQLIEKSQGKAARERAELLGVMVAKGVDPTSAEAQALRVQRDQKIALIEENERLDKALNNVSRAESDAKRAAEERRRELEQQVESQRRYADEAARAAAEMAGPLAVAEEERRQRIAELDSELAKHNITQAAYNQLAEFALDIERRRAAEIAQDQAAPQALLDTMTGELRGLTLLGPARERYQRQLRNEEDMRRAINDANKAGAGINAQVTESLIDQARAYADVSVAIEQQVADLQELGDVAVRGASGIADLFADTFSGNIKSSKDFFSTLKDVFKDGWRDLLRTMAQQNFVRPFQEMISNAISGAFNGASTGGGWMTQLAGLLTGGSNLTGTGARAAGTGWMGAFTGAGAAAGSMMGFGNNMGAMSAIAGAGGGSGGGIGDLVQIGGMLYKAVPAGGISGGMIAGASYAAGALGAVYGWKQGGDTTGKALGAAAYGAAGYYGATAVGTVAAGYAAAGTAGAAAAGSAALGAIPVVGWIALAAILVDKLSGGKLFGTKYETKETGQTIDIGADGGSVAAYAYQEGQKSLFRGKKRRTIDIDASEEAEAAADALYDTIKETARAASDALGLASVDIISGSFKAVYDKKGNLTSELSTVLGQTFKETFEEFQQRLQAENIIAQVGQLDDMASTIAERWRESAATLHDGAQFLLSAAVDFNEGAGLLSVGGLSRLTDLVEVLRLSGETMTDAYQRVMGNARAYASSAAVAYQEVATAGFSNFAASMLQVKQEEKERIRTLQAQAKALHGMAAREQDLAKVRESAKLKTEALITTLEGELVDLALNRLNDQIEQLGGSANGAGSKIQDFINSLRMSETLSVDTDATRRVTANDLMSAAALAGDADGFAQYAQQFLEVSRALNASAAGYQADYDRVMDLAKQFGTSGNAGALDELYAQRSALQAQQEAAARLERAQRIAQGVSDLAGVRGGDPLEILRNVTGMSAEALAGDLGLSLGELSQYLSEQQTDIGDLADILYELPQRIASEMVTLLADREVPVGAKAPATPTGTGTSTSSAASMGAITDERAVASLGRIEQLLQRQAAAAETAELLR